MKKIHVALVGYGNIGTGFCSNLHENRAILAERTGLDIELRYVCDIDLERERWFKFRDSETRRQIDAWLKDVGVLGR